jgi:hypothetical protein
MFDGSGESSEISSFNRPHGDSEECNEGVQVNRRVVETAPKAFAQLLFLEVPFSIDDTGPELVVILLPEHVETIHLITTQIFDLFNDVSLLSNSRES